MARFGFMSQGPCVHHLCLASLETIVLVELLDVWAAFGLEAITLKPSPPKKLLPCLMGPSHAPQLFWMPVNQCQVQTALVRDFASFWSLSLGPRMLLPKSALLYPQVGDVAPELLRIYSLILSDNKIPPGERAEPEGGREHQSSKVLRHLGVGMPVLPGSLPLRSPPRHQGCTAAAPDILGQTAYRQLPFCTRLIAW